MITLALVDDALPLRKLIGSYLSMQGFAVMFEAASGEEFLTQLAGAAALPDVCLLDANMPGIGGCGTATALRRNFPTVRIMAYSFFDEQDSPDTMLRCGAHHFVSKDAAPADVRDALIRLSHRPSGDA